MPVRSEVFTLSDTTATQIAGPHTMGQEVHLHNMSKSSNNYVHVGASDVTIANSIHIDPGQNLHLELRPGDDLWAVSDPDGLEVGVLTIVKRD